MVKKLQNTSGADTLSYRVRAKMDLNQADFAAEIGASIRSIRNWETRRTQPSGAAMKALRELARKHGVSSDTGGS